MKCALASVILLSVSSLGTVHGAEARPTLRAGAAIVDITPKIFPINMPGGFSANPAQSAHDPLNARALVLDDGQTTLAMVVIDNLGAGPEVLDEAKSIAAEKTGISTEKMLVSSTHTHTGASIGSRETSPPATIAYRKVVVDGIAESIIRAHAALQPATIGAASHPLPDEVFNRRWFLKPGKMPLNPFGKYDAVKTNPGTSLDVIDHPSGPTDPAVTVISVLGPKRRALALYANYSLHYVGGSPKEQISADYFGEFSRVMPSRLHGDENFVAMISNGASGDINNIPFGVTRPPREPFEQIRIVAQKAADAAWMAHTKIGKHRGDVRLGMLQREVTVKYRKPTEEQLAAAKAVLAVKDKEAIKQMPVHAQNYARNTVGAAERAEETLTVKIQAIRIGDLAVVGFPFETFVETGLDMKKRSPFPLTMVVGLANGRHGYLPTPEQHQRGGYETWLGTNLVQEDTSVILSNQLLEMLAELKKEG